MAALAVSSHRRGELDSWPMAASCSRSMARKRAKLPLTLEDIGLTATALSYMVLIGFKWRVLASDDAQADLFPAGR